MTLADIDWPMILAGLGLFLFGIEYMGDGLKGYSGDKMKDIVDKYTSSPFKGIVIGAFVTCLIQSSSGTTALAIGLIRSGLMGGEDAFVGKLDSLFTVSSQLEGEATSADITGLIGQYAHGNEPSHHITHMYNYVNRPWRTQELVDSVLHNQ